MLRSSLSSLREYLTPVTHKSSFQSTGEITPEEFVQAGDYLVYKFPTWSWSAASSGKSRSFLPRDKQFLVTKHVPSHQRAAAVSGESMAETLVEDGDWVVSGEANQAADVPVDADLDADIDTGAELDLEEADLEPDSSAPQPSRPVTSTERSYNVYITYSTSYRVPKLYLSGFDDNGSPLAPRAMFEDIIGDYKDKTATIESAPFQDNLTLVSIHPCKHARVMKIMLDKADSRALKDSNTRVATEPTETGDSAPKQDGEEEDEWEEVPTGLRVDQYLVIFLKFIASVTPTIEHDFTMSAL